MEIKNAIVQNILLLIENTSESAYIVGGAVRDTYLGIDTIDYDIVTSAKPEKVVKILNNYKLNQTFTEYGSIQIFFDNLHIQITTYRKEYEYFDYRHPSKVEYTDNLKDDLIRRDFTVNALTLNARGVVFDYFKGLNDLDNKIIRTIGNPYNRFNEDVLRILRAFKLIGKYNFRLENNTKKALCDERIYTNLLVLNKDILRNFVLELFSWKYCNYLIKHFNKILGQILPIFTEFTCFKRELKAKDQLNPLLIIYYRKDERLEELEKINIDEKEINLLRKRINVAKNVEFTDIETIKRIILENSWNFMEECLRLKCLFEKYPKNKFNELIRLLKSFPYTIKELCINGNDLIKLGIPTGPMIKNILNDVLKNIINKNIRNTKKEIIEYVKKVNNIV